MLNAQGSKGLRVSLCLLLVALVLPMLLPLSSQGINSDSPPVPSLNSTSLARREAEPGLSSEPRAEILGLVPLNGGAGTMISITGGI